MFSCWFLRVGLSGARRARPLVFSPPRLEVFLAVGGFTSFLARSAWLHGVPVEGLQDRMERGTVVRLHVRFTGPVDDPGTPLSALVEVLRFGRRDQLPRDVGVVVLLLHELHRHHEVSAHDLLLRSSCRGRSPGQDEHCA
jgi:hypothetical protein